MISTAIIARILSPEDFGLIAMVAVFTGFIGQFKDLGLSMATVQRPDIKHDQVSTLFWINVAASIVLAGIGVSIAPLVASFYDEPRLTLITIGLSCTFIFGGLGAQHTALLRRQMRFKALASIEIISMAAGVICSIIMAILGANYWALVGMTATQSATFAIASFCFSGWLPGRPKRSAEVSSMIRFGGNLTGFTLFNYFTRNADNLLIGRFVGAGALGVYSKAYALLQLPLAQINGPVVAVAMPALSRLQNNPKQFRNYYLQAIRTIAYASMPLIGLLCLLSEEVVFIMLGPQWGHAALIFQIFAAFAIIQPIVATTGWVYMSLDRTARMFRWGVINSIVSVIAIAIGVNWGAVGVAIASTIAAFILLIPTLLYAYHGTPINLGSVTKSLFNPILVTGALYFQGIVLYNFSLPFEPWARVTIVVAGAAATSIAILILCKQVRVEITLVLDQLRNNRSNQSE